MADGVVLGCSEGLLFVRGEKNGRVNFRGGMEERAQEYLEILRKIMSLKKFGNVLRRERVELMSAEKLPTRCEYEVWLCRYEVAPTEEHPWHKESIVTAHAARQHRSRN